MDDRRHSAFETVPEELIQFVKPELQPGESLLWAAVSLPKPSTAQPSVWRRGFMLGLAGLISLIAASNVFANRRVASRVAEV